MNTVTKNPNWWRKRTTFKRCRTIESVFTGVALFCLVTGLAAELQATRARKETDFCNTQECHHTASAVLYKMNTEIKPCDDFYQFACGAFTKKTQLAGDENFVTEISKLSYTVNEQLEIVIKEQRPETDPKHLRLPNDLYKACMNTTLIETLGSKPIKKIAERLGGWPVTDCDCWDKDNSWTWQETVQKSRGLGFNINYIFDFSMKADSDISNRRFINLDQPALGVGRKILSKGFNEPSALIYYDYMVDMAVLFGADNATAKMELKQALQFEMDLAKISWSKKKRLNSNNLNNFRSIKEVQKSYPYVQWLHYINALLPAGLTVREDEVINVSVPSFFKDLGKLLQRTKKRDIANYLMWRIHEYSADFLSEEFRQIKLQYRTALLSKLEHESRSKECTKNVLHSLAISVDSLYVRKYFKQDSKMAVLEMVNNIRKEFSGILNENQWMDANAKQEANKKLNMTTNHIGYPDQLFNDKILEEYYRKLNIDPVKYFKSSLRKNVFDTDNLFNELRFPVNAINWKKYRRPSVVNAFYEPKSNSIHLPAGILQSPFFNRHRPKYMNYGAIGVIIGHELIHGFNDKGSRFDGKGNVVNWWQSDTRNAYTEKAQCVIHQYGNYTEKQTGLYLNGLITERENIADHGGIKTAYSAYKQWVAQNGNEPKLPGLNYTTRQLFWISTAQMWCAKYRKKYTEMKITSSVHAPNEFRVLGTLSNMKGFARDFQCANDTRMNPVNKCKVW